jgi:hypothetical protein
VSRADADAMFAYLQSLPAVVQPNREHNLGFPFGTQAALAVWRALYFRPARTSTIRRAPPSGIRGAYLVEGLGHATPATRRATRSARPAARSTCRAA